MADAGPVRDKAAEAAAKFALLETAALDDRCSPLMVRIVHVMSALANNDREAWPSYDTLAFITGAARQNVLKAVERLWEIGYIIAIEKDGRPGRSKVNRYRLKAVTDTQPVWTLYAAWRDHKETCTRASFANQKESRQRAKEASQRARTDMLACPEPLNRLPDVEPSSETTVSAAAGASATWKGSIGEPLPSGFPDEEAMGEAAIWLGARGIDLNLQDQRRAFRNYHFSVRCLLEDWPRSWEMWIEDAMDAEAAK